MGPLHDGRIGQKDNRVSPSYHTDDQKCIFFRFRSRTFDGVRMRVAVTTYRRTDGKQNIEKQICHPVGIRRINLAHLDGGTSEMKVAFMH
jgi:hypothetical protein